MAVEARLRVSIYALQREFRLLHGCCLSSAAGISSSFVDVVAPKGCTSSRRVIHTTYGDKHFLVRVGPCPSASTVAAAGRRAPPLPTRAMGGESHFPTMD